MLELIGSAELWQWDTGRQVDCTGLQVGAKVQFAYDNNQTLTTAVKTADGANVADVPNQLLLRSGALMVYAYVTEADGVSYTKYAARLNVQARPKPDDYVYTPTEVQSWQTIRDEIGDLDNLTTTAKNNLVAAINEAAASGGGGGGSVTKDSIVTALGYTPADAPDALICTISGAGTDASPYACDKTTAEIDAAIQAGKTVQAMLEGFYYPLVARTGVLSCAFAGAYKASSTVRTIIVTQNGTVMVRSINMEDAANKTTDLSASSTNTQYPSAKAVWDAIPHPEAKTDAMTQAVGKDADGKLWTAPGGGSGGGGSAFSLIRSLTLAEQTDRVDITTGDGGSAFALTEVYVAVEAQSYTETAEAVIFLPNGLWTTNNPYITSTNTTAKASDTWKNVMIFYAICLPDSKAYVQQCPAKGNNNNLESKLGTIGGATITKISLASKLAAGCTVTVYGR